MFNRLFLIGVLLFTIYPAYAGVWEEMKEREELRIAFENGNLTQAKSLIENGVSAFDLEDSIFSPEVSSAMFYLLMPSVFKLSQGNPSDEFSQDQKSVGWARALSENNIRAVRYLIEEWKLDPNRSHWGKHPLEYARSVELFDLLVQKGANVNSIEHSNRPIYRSLLDGQENPQLTRAWLEKISDINLSFKWSPTWVRNGEILFNHSLPSRTTTFLFDAADLCKPQIVQIALELGADPSVKVEGKTALETLEDHEEKRTIPSCMEVIRILRTKGMLKIP